MAKRFTHLNPKKTLFFLCDIQEKFRPALPLFKSMVENAKRLTMAGKILDVPLLVTEQNPEKLGKIVQELEIDHAQAVVKKTRFSMLVPDIECCMKNIFDDGKPSDIVLYGIEEKFRPALPLFKSMVENAKRLTMAGKILDVPLLVTEQNPEKLGKIVQELEIDHAQAVVKKTRFSMLVPDIECCMKNIFDDGKPSDIVLYGIESHVCIEQTAIDLLERNINVFLVADCVASRTNQDRDMALERLRTAGCVVTTSESIIYDLLRDKENPKFNELRKLLLAKSADMQISVVHADSKL